MQAVAALPAEIQQEMAATPYWTRVRRARALLAEHFEKSWNPNRPIYDGEPWIYITATEDGDVHLSGVDQKALRTFESSCENAARRIAEKSHRVSTNAEIKAFLLDRTKREEFCAIEDERVNPAKAAQRASMRSSETLAKAAEAIAENTRATRESVAASQVVKTRT